MDSSHPPEGPELDVRLQIACVVVLWVVFLVFQQLKSRHNRCSAPYLALFAVELVLFIGATASGECSLWQHKTSKPCSLPGTAAATLSRTRHQKLSSCCDWGCDAQASGTLPRSPSATVTTGTRSCGRCCCSLQRMAQVSSFVLGSIRC